MRFHRDIERAIRSALSDDPHKRELQLEARVHLPCKGGSTGVDLKDTRSPLDAGLCEIHRRCCELLPQEPVRPKSGCRRRTDRRSG